MRSFGRLLSRVWTIHGQVRVLFEMVTFLFRAHTKPYSEVDDYEATDLPSYRS